MPLIDHRNICELLGGQSMPGNMSRDFLAVCVNRAGLGNIAVTQGVLTTLDFVAGQYDIGGWFDAGSPTIVTVPDGVTRVRQTELLGFFGNIAQNDQMLMQPTLNGSYNSDIGRMSYQMGTNTFPVWARRTAVYEVDPGDTISLQVLAAVLTPASFNVTSSCGLCVEAVTMEF